MNKRTDECSFSLCQMDKEHHSGVAARRLTWSHHPSCFMALRHFLLTFNWFAASVSDSRMSRTHQVEQLRSITALTGFSALLNSALLSPKYFGLFVPDVSELTDEELPVCIFG